MAVTAPLLGLTEVRSALADLLAPVEDDDPAVLADIPDAISPPMIILEWADPWLTPRTVAGRGGYWFANLNIVCFAGRLEPGPGVGVLEQLVGYTLGRLVGGGWPVVSMTAPRRFDYAGITYLGARIQLQVPVTPELEVQP